MIDYGKTQNINFILGNIKCVLVLKRDFPTIAPKEQWTFADITETLKLINKN